MNELARRKALLAATKVALSFSFVAVAGCAASVAAPDDETSSNDYSQDELRKKQPAHHCDSGTASCELPADGGLATDSTRQCCTALVASKMEADADWPQLTKTAASAPDVTACCHAIVNGYWSSGATADEKQMNAFNACCAALPKEMGPTCTPWGPPMPPKMPAAMLLEVA